MPAPKRIRSWLTSLKRMEPTEPAYPTDIVGRPVDTAYQVLWEGEPIGPVWREASDQPWNWALRDGTDATIIGGAAGTRSEASEAIARAADAHREGRLEGTRPPSLETVELELPDAPG